MENVHAYMDPAIPSIISGLALMVLGALGGWVINSFSKVKQDRQAILDMKEMFDSFITEHKTMVLAMKNVNRAFIIDICNRALKDGYISDTSFKCLCELEETYHMMHGNSYTDELIEKVKILYQNQIHFPSVLKTNNSNHNIVN